jgi:hypothetical protein
VKVRDATGREAEAEVTVPSGMLDVVLATTASGKSR